MPPPRFRTLPTPRRWPWRACGPRAGPHSCPNHGRPVNKNGHPHTGNTNKPGFMITVNGRYSITVTRAFNIGHRGTNCNGPPKTTYLNNPVNIFGRWAGAPGGSGCPPRNTF